MSRDVQQHDADAVRAEQADVVRVAGHQPFGGSHASGTNDKAGSMLNLLRWTTARAIKENFVPPKSIGYPHMAPETASAEGAAVAAALPRGRAERRLLARGRRR